MFHINDLIMGVTTALFDNLIQHRLLRKRIMWPANLPDLNPIRVYCDEKYVAVT
jgi:hypothetical protein